MYTRVQGRTSENVYLISRISVLRQKLRLAKPCARIWIITVFIPNSTCLCPSLLMKSHPGTSTSKNVYVCWGSDEHMTAACSTLPYKNSRMKASVKANNDFPINTHRNAHIATKLFLHPETLETSVNKEIKQQRGDTQEGIL